MSDMSGLIPDPQNLAQERRNLAYERALRFARKHYTSEAHIVEIVDKSEASDNAEQRQAAPGTLWHALIALEDSRHAVVGARFTGADDRPTNSASAEEEADNWSAFEVSPPTLGDVRGA